jgi:hypothetical protein
MITGLNNHENKSSQKLFTRQEENHSGESGKYERTWRGTVRILHG